LPTASSWENLVLASFLMGLAGGQRALTPLAAVSVAASQGVLPANNGAPRIIAHPWFALAAVSLAALELAGDKMKSAPDRFAPAGLSARFVSSSVAGAALAPFRRRWLGAALGGSAALAAAYPGWRARVAAMQRHGRISTGVVEDAFVLAGAFAIIESLARKTAPRA
jgi:uncharacterized membrane protein